jgi:MFS family permease
VSRFLASRPITTAVTFTVAGAFPLFLVSAQSSRLQSDLGFGTAELGFAIAGYFLFAAVGSLTIGVPIDRLGATLALRASATTSIASSLLIGVVAQNWLMVGFGLGISGIANTFSQLSANLIVAGQVTGARQGIAFGAKQAAIPLGSLIAGLTVSVLDADVSWRATFIAYAVFSAFMIAVVPKLEHESRHGVGRRSVRDAADGPLVMLLISGICAAAAGNSLAVLVVDSFVVGGFSESTAASVLAGGSTAAIVARVAVGSYVDRRQTGGYLELAGLMFVGTVGFLVLSIAGESRVLLFLGVALGFAAGWGWPALIYYVTVRASDVAPATATGFVLTGVYVGTIIGPPLLGSIADEVSYGSAWGVAAALIGVGGGAVLISRALSAGKVI